MAWTLMYYKLQRRHRWQCKSGCIDFVETRFSECTARVGDVTTQTIQFLKSDSADS